MKHFLKFLDSLSEDGKLIALFCACVCGMATLGAMCLAAIKIWGHPQ